MTRAGHKIIAAFRALGRNPIGSAGRAVRAAHTLYSGAKSAIRFGKNITARSKPTMRAMGHQIARGYRWVSRGMTKAGQFIAARAKPLFRPAWSRSSKKSPQITGSPHRKRTGVPYWRRR